MGSDDDASSCGSGPDLTNLSDSSPSTQLLDDYIYKESQKPPTAHIRIEAYHQRREVHYVGTGDNRRREVRYRKHVTYRRSVPFYFNAWRVNKNYCLSDEQREIVNKNFKKKVYLSIHQNIQPADNQTRQMIQNAINQQWHQNRHRDRRVTVDIDYGIQDRGQTSIVCKNGKIDEDASCTGCLVCCCSCFIGNRSLKVKMQKKIQCSRQETIPSTQGSYNFSPRFSGYSRAIDYSRDFQPPPPYQFCGSSNDNSNDDFYDESVEETIGKHNLDKQFENWDNDRSGYVDFEEFYNGMRDQFGFGMDRHQCLQEFQKFDTSNDDKLSYPEFVTFASQMLNR